MVVHYTPRPVLVVPHPLPTVEQEALAGGPVVIGWDGSAGAEAAFAASRALFAGRDLVLASADPSVESTRSPVEGVERVDLARGSGAPGRAVAEALGAYGRKRGAAALVVGTRGRSAAREILTGSVTMAALHHAHRQVTVVPGSREGHHGQGPAQEPPHRHALRQTRTRSHRQGHRGPGACPTTSPTSPKDRPRSPKRKEVTWTATLMSTDALLSATTPLS
ncbi:universal stress protein [Nonomuraea antri]|uniref:universal stress protein n=1 Tax=Nonomuraea antri TaxID=2730852 RepID=UPI001C2C238E